MTDTREWQPISTAPKDGRKVLLYFPDRCWVDDSEIVIGFWGGGGGEPDDWFDNEAASHPLTAFGKRPTHWMPLPLPPATQEKG